MSSPSDKASARSPTRAIAYLACASFASLAMVRVADTLLPQIAADLGTTVGAASVVATAYALTHGGVQLFVGPIGDRVGSFRTVALACAGGAVTVALCGLAPSLPLLALARLLSGACAAWIIPMSMAFIGDVTPYERRQQVLGRYLTGGISGLLFGQAAGGILGDHLGWRAVFFVLAGLFALAAIALVIEMTVNPLTRPARHAERRRGGFVADYRRVFGDRWARLVIFAVLLEAVFTFGPLTYVGADLHLRFGLSFTMVGAIVAAFGLGGLIYVASIKPLVTWLGQRGLVTVGGALLAVAYLILATPWAWWPAPLAVALIGLGYYMLHNTLQTNATQMTPEARGTAIAVFSSALYLGQMVGVAAAAPVVDRFGAPVVFVIGAIGLPALGVWFAYRLKYRA